MIRHWTRKRGISLLASILALPAVAFSQANSELTGIVTDQTGARIAGAKIVLVEPATGISKTTRTNTTGLYDISGLNPARYSLRVAARGFESFVQNSIAVNVSSTTRVDVKLTVGAESQTVTVEATALTVQTDSNVVSTLISSDQISEIATENRTFGALAALGLGVSSAMPDNNTPSPASANYTLSMNGLRPSHNIWIIDGGEADDRGGGGGMIVLPSQDAIAEFTVMSSNYPPDYGISSGATMSLSLKSGGKSFHGELFEFNRNTDYDANSYFNKLSTPLTPRAIVNYNIFGGNIGGPLILPHIYNRGKQKTFFFWNEEERRILSGSGTNEQNTIDPADLPTAGQNLTYVSPGFDPGAFIVVPNISTSTSYYQTKLKPLGLTPGLCWNGPTLFDSQGNVNGCQQPQVIPASLFDNDGILYLNSPIFPKPNVPGQDKNITSLPVPIDVRDDIVRIDHKFSDKWTVLAHYIHDASTQQAALPFFGFAWGSYNTVTSVLTNPCSSAAIKLTGVVNPSLLVEASINYDGNVIDIVNSPNSKLPARWSISPVSQAFADRGNSLPSMLLMWPYGAGEVLGTTPWHNGAGDYEPKVDISWTRAKHAMKFGFSYNRYIKNQQILGNQEGTYTPSNTTNDSLMDILLGLTANYTQSQAAPVRHYVNQTPSFYAMDNWHIWRRLSLQLGIRFDALPHAWERNNDIANFDPAAYQTSALPIWTAAGTIDPASPTVSTVDTVPFYMNGIKLAGVNGFPRGLVENNYATFQPRVGFSDDLYGNGKTVLRGGFGTFYERTQGNDIYNAAENVPFFPNLTGC